MYDNEIKDKIIDDWSQKTKGVANKDRGAILKGMAKDMGIPLSVISQHISEWEASQTINK